MQGNEKTDDRNVEDTYLTARSLEKSLGYKLRLAQILAYRNFEERLKNLTGYGVAPRYLGLLGIVMENPGQPQNRLAEAVGLQKSSLVTILDKLEQEGVLERKASQTDRRSKAVWLTAHGRKLVAKLFAIASEHETRVVSNIPAARQQELLAALDQIIENLRDLDNAASPEGPRIRGL